MSQNTQQPTSGNPFLYGTNADATNTPTLYAPGELGVGFYNQNNRYQRVLSDSGATAATPTGAIASGQVAFWVDKTKKVVTNDQRFAGVGSPATQATNAGARNLVAGIFRNATTPGNYTDILQKGNGVLVSSDNTTGAVGDTIVADGTASTARVTPVAIGTAPTVQELGIQRALPASNTVAVDVDIASVD